MEIETEEEKVGDENQGYHGMREEKMDNTRKELGSRAPEKVTKTRTSKRLNGW